MMEHGVKIDGETATYFEAPASLQDLTRARAALETIRSITDSLVTLGVLDAPAEAPLPDAEIRRVDGGILEQYETALQSEREDERVAHMAANDLRRVFLSDKEIQNTGTDKETWEIAVTRASQIRKRLNDDHPATDLFDTTSELKRARDQLLILAATFVSPEHGFDDEEKLILAAVTAAKRGMSPWTLGERVTNAEKAAADLRIDLGNVKTERDAAVRAWNEQTAKVTELSDANEHARRVFDEIQDTMTDITDSRDRWKERALAAERGQPGRFSNPTPPADEPAPEIVDRARCTGANDCPAVDHIEGCYGESWTRRSNPTEGTDK